MALAACSNKLRAMEKHSCAKSSPLESFRVQVCSLDGTLICEIPADPKGTVEQLKGGIETATGICARHQRLLFDACELADTDLLQDHIGHNGSEGDVCSISLIRQRARTAEALEWVEAVENDWRILTAVSPRHILCDIDVVLAGVAQDRRAIKSVPYLDMSSSEIIAIVKQNPDVFELIAQTGWSRSKLSEDVVWAALQEKPENLKFASNALKDSRAFILASVQYNGELLAFASKALRNDLQIVKAAVKQEPKALRFASDRLRTSHRVVIPAVQRDPDAFQYVLGWSRDRITSALKRGARDGLTSALGWSKGLKHG